MKTDIKSILIIGCQRSGTTLLASLLGSHSDINMLFESTTDDIFKLIGKKYQGNKLLAWRQIRWNQRSSKFGHLINRLVNFHFFSKKHHFRRPFPTSKFSVQDYLDKGTKIITIVRNKEATVSSIVKRSYASSSLASKEYDKAMKILTKLENNGAKVIYFEELVKSPEKTLKNLCNELDIPFESRMMEGTNYNFVYPNSIIDKRKASNSH